MKPSVPRKSRSRGFALVVTLSLMILLTVIAVGLLSLSSITLRSTAVGEADARAFMNARLAVMLAIGVMMLASGAISGFVSKHPSVKMLALSFLIMIGTALMAEALHFHIPKGYIYFSMVFSLGVELLNLKLRSKRVPADGGDI